MHSVNVMDVKSLVLLESFAYRNQVAKTYDVTDLRLRSQAQKISTRENLFFLCKHVHER